LHATSAAENGWNRHARFQPFSIAIAIGIEVNSIIYLGKWAINRRAKRGWLLLFATYPALQSNRVNGLSAT
jgi:hypothetical protein